METKFKVGDKVRIRKDLKEGNSYRIYVHQNMATHAGEIKTVCEIVNKTTYVLDVPREGGLEWHFTEDMLESAMMTTIDDLQFGDVLTLKNGERYVFADKYMYGEDEDYSRDYDKVDENYKDNLKYDNDDSDYREYDIVKVEREGQVIFEREDVREMTVEEISEALGYEVKVVK